MYCPGLSPASGTSSSNDTASRPSTFTAVAFTSGVSYTFVDPWINSRLLSRSMPGFAPLAAPSAAFSRAGWYTS